MVPTAANKACGWFFIFDPTLPVAADGVVLFVNSFISWKTQEDARKDYDNYGRRREIAS